MATTSDDRQRRQLKALLDHLASEDVPELIHQARQEARARVKEILTQAFVEAMLEHAGADEAVRAAPAPRVEDSASAAAPTSHTPETGEGLYVLCVIAASAPLPSTINGIDENRPRRIVHDELAAVVCPVPLAEFGEDELRAHLQDMAWLERVARAHEEALELISDETTLIPMRLCTVYRAESGVREMLIREEQALTQALQHLEGKREWGVKVFASDANAGDSPNEPPPEGGADYMRRRQHERDRRLRRHGELDDACHEIHERLSAVADDALTNPPQRQEVSGHGGEMVLNGVYLVDDNRLTEFLEAVGELRDRYEALGLELDPTGPWPAYNFVPGTIGAAW